MVTCVQSALLKEPIAGTPSIVSVAADYGRAGRIARLMTRSIAPRMMQAMDQHAIAKLLCAEHSAAGAWEMPILAYLSEHTNSKGGVAWRMAELSLSMQWS